jgi:hypothetical protein
VKQPQLSGAAALLLVTPQVIYSSMVLFRPYSFEEVKAAVSYVRQHWQPGDIVYVYKGAQPTFRYYAGRYGFVRSDYVLGHADTKNLAEVKDELEAAGSQQRLWVLFGHIGRSNGLDEDRLFRAQIPVSMALADSFKHKDAAAYLYVNAAR